MAGILIVDDDALVRMFLKQIVPWEDRGYTIVGDARDGEEALEKIEELHPDILLTDMSMSGMDGVELIQRAKADGFDGGVVVLSCHEDFSYVKTAMQLGADEYLLKNHLNGPDLLRVMDTVRDKLESRRAERGQLRAYARKGLRAMQHELLETLLAQENLPFDRQLSMTRDAGLHGNYYRCAVLLARLPGAAAEQTARFLELCGQFAAKHHAEAVRCRKEDCALLIDLSDLPAVSVQRETISQLASVVASYAWRYLGLPVSVGISSIHEGSGALSAALRQASEAVITAFYKDGTYWYGEDSASLTDKLPPAAQIFEQQVGEWVACGDAAQTEAAYRAALEAIGRARVQPGLVLYWLRRCDLSAGTQREEKDYAVLHSFSDYLPLGAAYTARARLCGRDGLPDEISPAIAAAVRFIRSHFSEQLTLAQTAEQAGLTQNYFSSLFKQEIGMGFSSYLTDCRLKYVCRRLTQSSDIIKQIAADAGFLDYQHFCRTFKKHLGVSPAEFRKSENPSTEIVK
ncbi:MAG: response regulator [Clostridiaceae bacterium]|nr:response regulator [Clostridiaceae bacterium]